MQSNLHNKKKKKTRNSKEIVWMNNTFELCGEYIL